MRIEIPREAERFGANLFYGVQKIFELDSGLSRDAGKNRNTIVRRLTHESLYDVEKDMVIVLPMKGEIIKLLQGVLYAVPHQCLCIIISNSDREPVDRFMMEKDAIEKFCQYTEKKIMVFHQQDEQLGRAFQKAGYSHILDENMRIKSGKAEGMIAGTVLARLTGRKYVGFIDVDNFFPGAIHEYIKIYSAGFAISQSEYALVRVAWHSKPKIIDSALFFSKYGRTSVVTNRFLNSLLSHYTGFETEVIKTGNAGEHAMTLDLAMNMAYASGYAVEPYHLIYLLERFGGIAQSLESEIIRKHIEIYQIESRNPHLHAQKGEEHVQSMIKEALQVIYHASVTPDDLKQEILQELRQRKIVKQNEELLPGVYYPSLKKLKLNRFLNTLKQHPSAIYLNKVVENGAGALKSKRKKQEAR